MSAGDLSIFLLLPPQKIKSHWTADDAQTAARGTTSWKWSIHPMLMILKISFLARSLAQIVSLKRKVKNEMFFCEYVTTPIWSCHLLECQISEPSHYYWGGNVQRLSNSMIMSSLFCPLEFFLHPLACHRHLWNSALRNGPWAGKQMPSSHYFYVWVLNPRVSLMGGEKKKDGYFPIAIYSELITTSLEGTNLKSKANLMMMTSSSISDTQKKMILSRMTLN